MADDLRDKAAELAKKVLTVGIGTIFLTEESLRNLVSDFKLPKELLAGILDSANKSKNEFFSKLSTEVMEKLTSRMDPSALVQEILEKNEFEFTIKLSLNPKGGGKKTSAAQDPEKDQTDGFEKKHKREKNEKGHKRSDED